MNSTMPNPQQMLLIAKVLKLYYEDEKSQLEISKDLRLSTAKVNRLIKQGRELGMVHVTIKTPLLRLFDLEKEISTRWNLRNCMVLPAVTGSTEATLREVGNGAASLLVDVIRDGDRIAISGGKSLSALIEALAPNRSYDVNVVPMTGGVQGQHYTDVNHIATKLAEKLSGKATLLHAPLHAESPEERDLVMSVKSVKAVMDAAADAAVAVMGLGSVLGKRATYYELNPASEADREALYSAGVRGELLGHLIQGDGSLSENVHNSRLVALSPNALSRTPISIGIGSGLEKVEPIIAALNGGYINSLVTDEVTATAVLDKGMPQ